MSGSPTASNDCVCAYGDPMLCDFGEARTGSKQTPYNIQPEIYKAFETLMELEWGHPVDIWNAACVVSQYQLSVCEWC